MECKDMDYISKAANSLLSRSRCTSILAAEIYTAIAEWEKREIPLRIVLISIEEVCADVRDVGTSSESIYRLQAVVSRNFRDWLIGNCAEKDVVRSNGRSLAINRGQTH